jgi:TonB family protein
MALTFACVSLFVVGTGVAAQSQSSSQATTLSDSERGIELFFQNDNAGAITALRRAVKKEKNDLRAWHFIGLALSLAGQTDDARKAHEKAAKIGEQLLVRQYDAAPLKLLLERQKQLKTLIDEAAESAEAYLQLSAQPSRKKVSEWQERAEFLREFSWLIEHSNDTGPNRIFAPQDVTTKAKILSRAEPQYTEDARQHDVRGVVILRAVLAADGQVRGIRPIRMLPYGLTMKAVKAARQMNFIPATLNGEPVSQWIQLEYHFNLY